MPDRQTSGSTTLDPERTALLVIDVQRALTCGRRLGSDGIIRMRRSVLRTCSLFSVVSALRLFTSDTGALGRARRGYATEASILSSFAEPLPITASRRPLAWRATMGSILG